MAEEEHDADTPIRQAQRAMLQEREVATAAHANEDVLGMRLQAVSEGADVSALQTQQQGGSGFGLQAATMGSHHGTDGHCFVLFS